MDVRCLLECDESEDCLPNGCEVCVTILFSEVFFSRFALPRGLEGSTASTKPLAWLGAKVLQIACYNLRHAHVHLAGLPVFRAGWGFEGELDLLARCECFATLCVG